MSVMHSSQCNALQNIFHAGSPQGGSHKEPTRPCTSIPTSDSSSVHSQSQLTVMISLCIAPKNVGLVFAERCTIYLPQHSVEPSTTLGVREGASWDVLDNPMYVLLMVQIKGVGSSALQRSPPPEQHARQAQALRLSPNSNHSKFSC